MNWRVRPRANQSVAQQVFSHLVNPMVNKTSVILSNSRSQIHLSNQLHVDGQQVSTKSPGQVVNHKTVS